MEASTISTETPIAPKALPTRSMDSKIGSMDMSTALRASKTRLKVRLMTSMEKEITSMVISIAFLVRVTR
jgi:hypothetical protein